MHVHTLSLPSSLFPSLPSRLPPLLFPFCPALALADVPDSAELTLACLPRLTDTLSSHGPFDNKDKHFLTTFSTIQPEKTASRRVFGVGGSRNLLKAANRFSEVQGFVALFSPATDGARVQLVLGAKGSGLGAS